MIDGGKEYTYPLELFACKEALLRGFKARQTWTLREFAYLLAGFSPQVVDNNLEESEWFQTDVLPFRQLLGEAVTENADTEYFNGFAPSDVQRNYGDTAYPVEAFIDFCSKRKIDFPLKAEIDDYFRPSFAAESAPATVAPSPESAEVADGLTVVAVRKVFDSSPALRDIVMTVAEVQAMPRDGVQKPSAETVEAKIRRKAKAHGWGLAKDGSLSDTQWKVLKSVVFGLDRGGRPTKDDGKPPEGF